MHTTSYLTIVLLLFAFQKASCDIIPENSHYVNNCVKITNINEYDNLVLLGYIWSVGNYHGGTYKISAESCLTNGYKFNTLRIFATDSTGIIGKDIDKIDLPNDKNALETNIEIYPYKGYYHDSIPIDKFDEYYKILGFTDTSIVIYKWKEVFGFNNGSEDSIVTHDYHVIPLSYIRYYHQV
ncbi:MAG: hypothetical protein GVY19_11775 [Bacteroidetes bacterium]|jgi:hypothetical protein|nr:hypothetical protein [Bacteroidota bacterium]